MSGKNQSRKQARRQARRSRIKYCASKHKQRADKEPNVPKMLRQYQKQYSLG